VAVGDPPLASFAAIHLGGAQRVRARLTINRSRGVLQASRVGHVTYYVEGVQVEGIRLAAGKAVAESGKELGELLLAKGVAPCA
jgi:hypothetical protein